MIHNFGFDEAVDFSASVLIEDHAGVAIDLSLYTADMHIRRRKNDTTPLLAVSTGSGHLTLYASGVIEIVLSDTEIALLGRENVYDIEIESPANKRSRPLQGNMFVVTDNYTERGTGPAPPTVSGSSSSTYVSGQFDWFVQQGANFFLDYEFFDETGAIRDLSTYTVTGLLSYGGLDGSSIVLNEGGEFSVELNVLTVSLTASKTAAMNDDGTYWIQIESSGGIKEKLVRGAVVVDLDAGR